MKILVTRPDKQAKEFAQELIKRNFTPIISPLLEISLKKTEEIDSNRQVDSMTHILITSCNALHALAPLDKNVKIYTIGESTFNKIKELSFINVHLLGKDVEELKKNLNRQEKILYFSGDQLSYDFIYFPNVRREIVYYSKFIVDPNQEFFTFFSTKEPKIITLFSLRTARNLVYLIRKNNLQHNCHNIILVCLSKKILAAQEIENIRFKACYYPNRPNILELTKLLEKITDDEEK